MTNLIGYSFTFDRQECLFRWLLDMLVSIDDAKLVARNYPPHKDGGGRHAVTFYWEEEEDSISLGGGGG